MSFNLKKGIGAIIDEMMIQMIQMILEGVIAVREVIAVKIRSNIQNPEGKGKARENKAISRIMRALNCISFY